MRSMFALACFTVIVTTIGGGPLLFAQHAPAPPQAETNESRGMAEAGQRWMQQGAQVGAYMDEFSAYTLEGKSTKLSRLWKDRPVLLVTASLTCPVARRQCPSLKSIIDAHDPEVRIVVLYTIEAHPQGDDSPYSPGREWITPQNEQAKVLHRQPKSLEDRLTLARDMNARLGEVAPMLVDAMDNAAWKALGGGPNMAVLIDVDGKVVAKQGWLDAAAMAKEIDALLTKRNEQALAAYDASKKARPRMEAFVEAFSRGEPGAKEKFLSPHARIWFEQKTGPGTPLGVSPWREWDATLNARHEIESAKIEVDSVVITSRETNDFSRLIGFAGWRATSTYWFDADGRIIEQLHQSLPSQPVTPSFRECFKPALDWATKTMPDEVKAIYPNNDFAPSADTARRWREALIAWRAATGLPAVELGG